MSVTSALTRYNNKTKRYFDFEPGTGLVKDALHVGAAWASGVALGEAHARYREGVKGVPVTLIGAAGGKLLAIASNAFFGGKGASYLNQFSTVAVGAHGFTFGISHGYETEGHATKDAKAAAPALNKTAVVGQIPPAAPGAYLSDTELAHYRRQ